MTYARSGSSYDIATNLCRLWNDVFGYLLCSMYESAPMILASSGLRVSMVSVFLLVAVFSTMEKGCPGLTRVILKKEEPKSKPITLQCDTVMHRAKVRARVRVLIL